MKKIFKEKNNIFLIILLVLMIIFWGGTVWHYSRDLPELTPGDFQRDTAITHHFLSGGVIYKDAAYLGEYAWYPYLSHLIYALFHLLTRIPVTNLYLSYSLVLILPTVLLFIFCTAKIFRSVSLTMLATFALIFVFPMPAQHLTVVSHPFGLTLGILTLGLCLFWRAITSPKLINYLLAGAGISLTIYSQPFAALTLCGGITLYQLLTRKHWPYFFLMVITAFVLASPFIIPLLFVYRLQAINYLNINFLRHEFTLDRTLGGFGPIRWLNCLLVFSGILVSFLRRKKIDLLLISMYFFSLAFVVWGVLTELVAPLTLVQFQFPKTFVWQDLIETNQFIGIFFFGIGALYWLKEIPRHWRFAWPAKKVSFFFFLFFLGIYALLLFPKFVDRAQSWYPSQEIYFPYDANWQSVVKWIESDTQVNDVFLAHSGPSYLFISGMTGRKVIITDNHHSNSFVDQQSRINDHWLMYTTTDFDQFLNLAKKYHLKYAVVSPYEEIITHSGLKKFEDKRYFQPVYSSGPISIYELKD